MANLSYNKKQTALIIGGRSNTVQPTLGDLFVAVWDHTGESEYNDMVDWYLQAEIDISAAIAGNFTVTGRDHNNDPFPVTDAPSHPFPGRKP